MSEKFCFGVPSEASGNQIRSVKPVVDLGAGTAAENKRKMCNRLDSAYCVVKPSHYLACGSYRPGSERERAQNRSVCGMTAARSGEMS